MLYQLTIAFQVIDDLTTDVAQLLCPSYGTAVAAADDFAERAEADGVAIIATEITRVM